ncbi:hypothetical protein ALI22I_17975 [Saccharothrix sp. ALI-22-I]|uniref:NB-ARC domain-containing protein n=1 Tax=Saccharothrix sp. ALI-22-I TaxID=1933778 RepID=UPI0009C99A5A|nr:NB-ARC domain-containing protein [Saccharothrix sp. ALI-22-I]ONI88852.1 hypothetical protein ALI22I_17975 [Saccharothrix sp. ALI-22-I]
MSIGASGERPVPQLLPPDTRVFVNRTDEVAELVAAVRAAWDQGHIGLVVLTGMPGVGKTTLAVRLGYRLADDFPDGRLFYDLRGSRAEGPVSPAAVLRYFLIQLGVEQDRIPAEESELAAFFRSVTSGRRILVVLDDAATAAQVIALLPSSAKAAVVVTSRQWLEAPDLAGVRQLLVEPLRPEFAVELIHRSVGEHRVRSEPAALESLVKLCAGLPLALAIASAWLVPPRRTLTAMVDKILTGRSLDALGSDAWKSAEAVMDLSYGQLTPAQARAYRLLSLHPGAEFGHPAAAALLGLPEQAAVEVLEGLADANLLSPSADERYRFHPLVARHARDRALADASPEDMWEARTRVADWYVDRAVVLAKVLSDRWWVSDRLLNAKPAFSGPDAVRRALGELNLEDANLSATLAMTEEWGLDERFLTLCEALWPWYYNTDRADDLMDTRLTGLAVAQRSGDQESEMLMLNQLGAAHEMRGDLDAAIGLVEKSLALAESLPHVFGQQSNLEWLGLAWEQKNDPAAGIDYLRRSLALIDRVGKPEQRERAIALNRMHLGRMLFKSGEHAQAIAELRPALTYFTDRGDVVNRARTLYVLGCAHLGASEAGQAAVLLERAVGLFGEIGFRSQQVAALEALASTEELLGDVDAAGRHRAEAQRLRDELES